jgi:N-acetylglucosamine-6-phosphate deacetylase
MEDGVYDLVGYRVHVKDGKARLENGTIAGCTTPLNRCVHHVIEHVGVSSQDALKMSTTNPAQVIGVADRIGTIEIGMDASLVVFDDEFNISLTMVRGEVVYNSQ